MMDASRLNSSNWNARSGLRALATLGLLVTLVVRRINTRALWGLVGVLFIVAGACLFATSFSTFNILQAEFGTMLFLVGANVVVWSTDR